MQLHLILVLTLFFSLFLQPIQAQTQDIDRKICPECGEYFVGTTEVCNRCQYRVFKPRVVPNLLKSSSQTNNTVTKLFPKTGNRLTKLSHELKGNKFKIGAVFLAIGAIVFIEYPLIGVVILVIVLIILYFACCLGRYPQGTLNCVYKRKD